MGFGFADEEHVFEADAEFTGEVDAGFDGNDGVGVERFGVFCAEVGDFVDV